MHSLLLKEITYELTLLILVLDLNGWFATLADNLERPVLLIALDLWVTNLTTDETFGVEHGVFGVGMECVLCAVTDTVCKQ